MHNEGSPYMIIRDFQATSRRVSARRGSVASLGRAGAPLSGVHG